MTDAERMDRERETAAIAAIQDEGKCVMSPATYATLREAMGRYEAEASLIPGVISAHPGQPLYLPRVEIDLFNWLPAGKVFPRSALGAATAPYISPERLAAAAWGR